MRLLNKNFLILAAFCGLMSGTVLADSQKPSVPNGLSAVEIDSTSAKISWNKPWDNVGVEGYNVYRNNRYYKTVNNTNFIDYKVEKNGRYEYAVVAFDKARNFTAKSAIVAVEIKGSGSSSAPAPSLSKSAPVPTGLRSEVQNGNESKIFWKEPSDNIQGYNIYRNGRYIASSNLPEYRDTNMSWGKDYRYQVVAYTEDKKFSPKSSEHVVNTAGNSSNDDSQSSSEPSSSNVPAGYRKVFADEFNGNSLDGSKWNTQYRWGPWLTINNEKQFYVDILNNPNFGHSPYSFDGNHMTISATRTPDWLKSSANWKPYLSGAMTTYNKFKMKYGYVEMRAKLPRGKGLWSAFWLLHNQENGNRPEIDVVEYIGDQPNVAYNTYHYFENNQNLKSSPSMQAWGPDYSKDFHTYAVKWEPGKITWYVDGEERHSYTKNVAWEDMYLLVNLALGGTWAGDPDSSTPFPARMTIDYIRAYQK